VRFGGDVATSPPRGACWHCSVVALGVTPHEVVTGKRSTTKTMMESTTTVSVTARSVYPGSAGGFPSDENDLLLAEMPRGETGSSVVVTPSWVATTVVCV